MKPLQAKRSFGQNFLRDEKVISRIVRALDVADSDTIIEIGPGHGALTSPLVKSGARVIAIEADRELVGPLKVRFATAQNLQIIAEDALTTDFSALAAGAMTCKLVANLPYNISTPILQRTIEQRMVFERLVLMFQREVVDRITASPGTRDRGFLTVLVEDAFEVERLFDVRPEAFRPIPKVTSAVVRLKPKASGFRDNEAARRLLSTAFLHKRKTLLNNLKQTFPFIEETFALTGIEGSRRAESLSLEEWHLLADRLAAIPGQQNSHP